MRKKRPSCGAYEKDWARFVMSYRLGEQGKTSRKVGFKRALYLEGNRICKPFRKE